MHTERSIQIDDAVQAVDSKLLNTGMYRVVLLSNSHTHLVEICKRPRKLYKIERGDFFSDIRKERIKKIVYETPYHLLLPEEEIPVTSLEEMNRRCKIIAPAISAINDVILRLSSGQELIKECIKKSKELSPSGEAVNKTTVYLYIYRFLMYGRVERALLPDRFLQGARGKIRTVSNETKIRGRPRKNEENIITINIDISEREIIKKAYKNYYKKLHKPSGECCNDLVSLLNAIWYDNYIESIDPHGKIKYKKQRISETQLRDWLPKLIDNFDILERKVGSKNLAKDYKESYGTMNDIADGPAHVYAIDANTADTYLGSEYEYLKENTTGKPFQYNVVDVFSGMLAWSSIDFRDPCLARFMEALLGAIMKKSIMGEIWGIKIDDKDWPCDIIAYENLGDRGSEFITPKKNIIHGRLNVIASSACPAYRPEQKALVESTNKIFNQTLFHKLPGAVIKAIARGDKHPAELACIIMPEIYKLVTEVAYDINRRLLDRKYLTPQMLRDGVRPQPIEIWNWGLENCNSYGIPSSNFDNKLMLLSLSEQVTVRANEKGIYTLEDKGQDKIFYQPANKDIQKFVRLYHNNFNSSLIADYYTGHRISGSVNFLYLISKKDSQIIKCRIHSRSRRLLNMHIQQVTSQLEYERHEDREIKKENAENKAKTTRLRRGIAKNALNRLKKGKPVAKARRKNINEDRNLEQTMLDLKKKAAYEKQLTEKNIINTPEQITQDPPQKKDSKDDDDLFDDFIKGI
ncbi:hypothetical protein ACWJJH_20045 [Endozoicomonadaceae bacterium StTr2]